MRIKKSGLTAGIFAALTAVLFITAILITSCLEPITMGYLNEYDGKKPEPGKGIIVFNITDVKGRFVTPDVEDETDFEAYDVYIYEGNGSTQVTAPAYDGPNPLRITTLTAQIELPADDYVFKLNAFQYNKGTSPNDPGQGVFAATGTSAVITIQESTNNSVPVTLSAVGTGGGGSGRFSYKFTFPAHGLTTATMDITPLFTGGTALTGITLTNGADDNRELVAGYYMFTVSMANGANFLSANYMDTILINEGMSSTGVITLPALKNIAYNLTFNFRDGENNAVAAATTHGMSLGTFISSNSQFDDANISHPTDNTLTFKGWFLSVDDAVADSPPVPRLSDSYVFINNNQTLFAGWSEGTTITFTPTYAANDNPLAALTVNSSSTDYTQAQGSGSITFTVPNPDRGGGDYEYDNFRWYTSYEGQLAETGNILVLTIDNSPNGVKYKALGKFNVTVIADNMDDGQTYLRELEIEVKTAP